MTREEKITYILEQIMVDEQLRKMIRMFINDNLPNADDEAINKIYETLST